MGERGNYIRKLRESNCSGAGVLRMRLPGTLFKRPSSSSSIPSSPRSGTRVWFDSTPVPRGPLSRSYSTTAIPRYTPTAAAVPESGNFCRWSKSRLMKITPENFGIERRDQNTKVKIGNEFYTPPKTASNFFILFCFIPFSQLNMTHFEIVD